jgi:histidinol-phosphatase (PHP family)
MSTPASRRIPHDYHTHTNVSCDSQATMAQMCQSALDKGIREIAFTEHFDPKPNDPCFDFYDPAVYFENLDAARREFEPRGLAIRAGVELGEHHLFHAVHDPVLAQYPYDVALGSLHWVGEKMVFDKTLFQEHEPRDIYAAYFTELAQMVSFGGFDVLSHADVFKRTAFTVYGAFDIAEWEDMVRPVWQACIEGGIGIEINTAGLRLAVNEVHPGPAALRWYREMGGELLTIGSDGHRPEHVGYRLDTALELARAAGFTRVCSFERRQVAGWTDI